MCSLKKNYKKMVLLFYSKYQEAAGKLFLQGKLLFLLVASWFWLEVAQSWLPSYLSLCYCDSGATFTVSAKTVNVVRESDKAVMCHMCYGLCIAPFL